MPPLRVALYLGYLGDTIVKSRHGKVLLMIPIGSDHELVSLFGHDLIQKTGSHLSGSCSDSGDG